MAASLKTATAHVYRLSSIAWSPVQHHISSNLSLHFLTVPSRVLSHFRRPRTAWVGATLPTYKPQKLGRLEQCRKLPALHVVPFLVNARHGLSNREPYC